MSDRICVLGHRNDPERPRRAADSLLVCLGCRSRMGDDLTDLAELHKALTEPASRKPGQPLSGTRDPAMPIAPRNADLRRDIEDKLFSWARVIVEDLRLTSPVEADRAIQHDSVYRLVAFVGRHLDWLAGQPFVDEYAAEISELRHKAWSAAYPSGRRSFTVGRCTQIVGMDEDAPIICEGELTAVLRDSDDLLPSELVCSASDEHNVSASAWLALGRKLKQAEERQAS